jgi:restriction endonuclease S subunit
METDTLPKGWEVASLGDGLHFQLIMGQSPPSETYNERSEGLPFFQGKADFGELHPMPRIYCSAPSRIARVDDVLMSVRAPVGPTNLADRECCIGRGLAAVRCNSSVSPRYLLSVLRCLEPDIAHLADGQGGGFTCLRKKQLAGVSVPVPPLAEQRRLVARLEALTGRARELRGLNASLVEDATRLLAAEYDSIRLDCPTRRFGDIAKLVRRRVEMHPDESYHELGIRSFGKGTFHKPALTGRQIGNKRVFLIRPGDLVFMNVFAWEGAIAVAKIEDEGRVGSHRFMAHEVDPAQATAEFLCYHLLTEKGLEHIRAASPGSAGRNRTLGITKLHAIPVPTPPAYAQRRFSTLHALREELSRLQTETEGEFAAFTPALLAKAFRGEL